MIFVLVLSILIIGTVVAPHPNQGISGLPMNQDVYNTAYFHRLSQVHAYVGTPSITAPLSPPWPEHEQTWQMQRYVNLLHQHDAYIDPEAGRHLDRLRKNAIWLYNHRDSSRISAHQRSFVAAMEEAGEQARQDLQAALHPVNVRAQHVEPLRSLANKLTTTLNAIEGDLLNHLASGLSVDEWTRLNYAHLLLKTERDMLILAADRYATRLPRLGL
ncbi:uncharacterized protein PSANT_03428 [Moesziomyces antarcticus]|uniref:Uncharacterized protein n=1 Tax=Pseudozyma antarctica TaxID=84753 RepID=A0A5C3FMW6_PSEA2|nr:uncharacterized protein PSANT_03428 [Moesziomyces antarcticus]